MVAWYENQFNRLVHGKRVLDACKTRVLASNKGVNIATWERIKQWTKTLFIHVYSLLGRSFLLLILLCGDFSYPIRTICIHTYVTLTPRKTTGDTLFAYKCPDKDKTVFRCI